MLKKKLLVFSVSLIMIVLNGCGYDQKADKNRSNGSYDSSVKLEGNLITKAPLDLDVHLYFRNRINYNEDWPVAKEAARLTNIRLHNTITINRINSSELFDMMMMSGDLPDIVGGDNREDDFISYGMEGKLLPLNELISEHAPNIKEFLERNKQIKDGITAPDGNIYFLPYVQDGKVARGYWIRKDWLNKLGLNVPNTIDELYDVLIAFRDEDPNGNGQKDEYPMIFRHWYEMIRLTTLWGARTAGTDTYVSFYKDKDDQIAHGWWEPEFKEGIKHVIKWYNEGLIDPEVFTRGGRTREILFSSDQGGMTRDWMASTGKFNGKLADEIKGFDLQPMLPPLGTTGKRIEESHRTLLKPDGWAITSSNKKPIETIMYFDFFFTKEGRRLANFGVEGIHYDLVDGKPIFKKEILGADKPVNQQMWDIGAQIPIGFQMDYEYERQWSNETTSKGIEMYEKNITYFEDFIAPTLTPAERKIYDVRWPAIQSYMEETIQRWILENGDVEKEWDNYIRTLTRLGLPEVIKVYQDALIRQEINI